MDDAQSDGRSGPPGRPESAQVPLDGSQPMVGSRRERRELITTSRDLYAFADSGSDAR